MRKENQVKHLKQLETWCNLKCGDIIFDSTKHGWSKENNEFNKKFHILKLMRKIKCK